MKLKLRERKPIEYLDLLNFIDEFPISRIKKTQINEHISSVVPTSTKSDQLIRAALDDNFKLMKEDCMNICFGDFLSIKNYHEYYQLNKMTAAYLLGVYYYYNHKLQLSLIYLKISEYLGNSAPMSILDKVKDELNNMPNQKYQLGTTNKASITFDPNTNYHTDQDFSKIIDYYLFKIELTGNVELYLPTCTEIFNRIHKFFTKGSIDEESKIMCAFPFLKMLSQLSTSYKKYERWDEYCIFASKLLILKLDSASPIRLIINDLLDAQSLIDVKLWETLPDYLARHDEIVNYCLDSLLYNKLSDINKHILNEKDSYLLQIIVYYWEHNKLSMFVKSNLFQLVLLSYVNETNNPLFIIIKLLTIPEIVISYKNRITQAIEKNVQIFARTNHIVNALNGEYNGQNMWLINDLKYNKELIMQNLDLLCEYSLTINGIFESRDARLYIFWYFLEYIGSDISPSEYFIEGLFNSNFVTNITIRSSYLISNEEYRLTILQHLYACCYDVTCPDFYCVAEQRDMPLVDLLKIVSQNSNIKNKLLTKTCGVEYLSIKAHFENTPTMLVADDTNLIIVLEDLIQSFLPLVQNSCNKPDIASDVEHLVFFNLLKLKAGISSRTENGFNNPSKFTSNIFLTIGQLEKIIKKPNYHEIFKYYYQNMFKTSYVRGKKYGYDSLLSFFVDILIGSCNDIKYYGGMLRLYNMRPDFDLPIHSNVHIRYQLKMEQEKSLSDTITNLRSYALRKIYVLEEMCESLGFTFIAEGYKLDSLMVDTVVNLKVANDIKSIILLYRNCNKYETFLLEQIRLRPPSI